MQRMGGKVGKGRRRERMGGEGREGEGMRDPQAGRCLHGQKAGLIHVLQCFNLMSSSVPRFQGM